jgi:hypothetical protein
MGHIIISKHQPQLLGSNLSQRSSVDLIMADGIFQFFCYVVRK